MPRVMLDTDICIYIQKRKAHEVLEHFRNTPQGDAIMSAVTWGELVFGAQKSAQKASVLERLAEFRTIVPVLPLSAEAGAVYGLVRAKLQSEGRIIGNNDLWIAAHAMAANLTLVTNNEREFARIDGLKIENWTRA